MFTARFFAIFLLLSVLPPTVARGQDEAAARPRRSQSSRTVTAGSPPSPAAIAEAKRLYKAGVRYGLAGLYRPAADTFEQAIKLNPGYADAYFSLGHAYADLQEWEQAVDNLEHGLSLKPNDKDAIRQLAEARSMLQNESRPKLSLQTNHTSRQVDSSAPLHNKTVALVPASDADLTKVYRVGPGDILEVRLSEGTVVQPALFTITPAGQLEYPNMSSPLPVAGLTVEEIAERIEDELARRLATKRFSVSVTVNEYVSHTILVSGLVNEPGAKIIKREAIPLYVVVADARALPEADSVIVSRHDSNESYIVDLAKPAEMSMLVRPHDVVTLQASPKQFFYVSGEVKEPGEKILRRGLTLTQAIIASGGLTKDGKEARLARDNGSGFLVVSRYKLKDIDSGKMVDPMLQPGDRITIIK